MCFLTMHCGQSTSPQDEKPKAMLADFSNSEQTDEEIKAVVPPISNPAPDYDTLLWSEIAVQEYKIQLDLRYASENNFIEEQLYECPRCFLRPEAAKALYQVQEALQDKGYGLKLFDCYRPTSVQERLWEKVPNASYVTPPHKGSMHNRGFAIDATLLDAAGTEVDMGTEFDYFGRRAHHDNKDLDQDILKHRALLKNTMAEFGFKHIRTEWWHYSFRGPYQSPFKLADYQWSCEEEH